MLFQSMLEGSESGAGEGGRGRLEAVAAGGVEAATGEQSAGQSKAEAMVAKASRVGGAFSLGAGLEAEMSRSHPGWRNLWRVLLVAWVVAGLVLK